MRETLSPALFFGWRSLQGTGASVTNYSRHTILIAYQAAMVKPEPSCAYAVCGRGKQNEEGVVCGEGDLKTKPAEIG